MKKILLLTIVLSFCISGATAANLTYIFPEGWEHSNVWLNQSQVEVGVNEETVYITPYYYAAIQGSGTYGCSVVTTIKGYYDPNGGWIVKAPKDNNEQANKKKVAPNNPAYDWNQTSPGAFNGFTAVKKLILPPTIKSIGQLAFKDCAIDELVCMAINPPKLVRKGSTIGSGDSFGDATIGKIIVPTGTLAAYKATDQWKDFTIVEGAEVYSDHQMVEHNGAWYEVINGEASLVNCDNMTEDMKIPENVSGLINGQWKTIPVKQILPWSIGKDVIVGPNIPDIPDNWYDGGSLTFTNDHPQYRSLAPNVVTNKNGSIAYFIFKNAVVPHGVKSLANNALNYCSTAYLPTTLNFIGMQSAKATLYFTSEQPPSTSMTSYSGKVYAPEAYKSNYSNGVFLTRYTWDIPAGYEYFSDQSLTAYWNPNTKGAILKGYTLNAEDLGSDGYVTLPSSFNYTDSEICHIEECDVTLNKKTYTEDYINIRIPEGIKTLTKIYISDFSNISKELLLPSTLEKCCPLSSWGLTAIKIAEGNPKYDSRNNCNALIETATNTIISACSTTTIPSSIEHIGESAFEGVRYTGSTISIPASVKSIGKHAFERISKTGWTSLQVEFDPSASLICIEDSAFWCANITKLCLPNSLERIGMWAFASCEGLKEVTFGNSLKEIGDFAFRGCALNSLVFPDALEKIGEEAFYGIPTLESIQFGKSLREIGYRAFHNTAWYDTWYETQPDGVVYLGKIAYTYKGDMPKGTTILLDDETVGIAGGAFSNCFNLSSIYIPQTVTSIGGWAFYNCNGLTSVTIPNSVTSIGSAAFEYCNSLESITIGNSVTSIGSRAFSGCYGLTSVTIPNSVTSIGEWAFRNCSGLMSVTIGSGVTSIGKNAFSCGIKLSTVNVNMNIPIEIDESVFEFTGENYSKDIIYLAATLNVPIGSKALYSNVKGWKKFMNINEVDFTPKHKLLYVVDGVEYKVYEIAEGATITPEPAPTKEGYTFSGWSEIPETMPAHDVTVTGTFSINKYKLTYKVDGVEYKSYELEYGATITPEPTPTKEGYTFSGWSEIPETMPAHDVTVTGTFSINKYKLTYKVDGVEYKVYEIAEGATITPEPAPTKEGYTFSGWSEIPETMPAHDVTVTGTFSINKYKLTYKVDGVEYKSYELVYGAEITPEPTPTKEGYTFSGWSEIPETMPAHDVTVTGTFSINKYKLTYKVDGVEYKSYELEYGATITPEPTPTKEGYTFSGWSEIPETMPAHDVTVTGSFAVNQYLITYMIGDEVYQKEYVDYGATIVLPNVPEREGYSFAWIDAPEKMPAHDITINGAYTSGMWGVSNDDTTTDTYTIGGYKTDKPRRGVNIIRMSDGTTRKVVVK